MNMQVDDPRLTAYALNELDEAQRGEVEAILAASPEARRELEAIRATAGDLSRELAGEPLPETPGDAQQKIEARLLATRMRRWVPAALAACVVLSAGVYAINRVSSLYNATPVFVDVSHQMSVPAPKVTADKDAQAKLAMVLPEIQFTATPFREAIEHLGKRTGLNIVPNWASLEAVGVEKGTEVSLNVRNVSAKKALGLVLNEVGAGETQLAFADDDDVVQVSTLDDLSRSTATRVYVAEDLVVSIPTFRGRQTNLDAIGPNQPQQGGLGGGRFAGSRPSVGRKRPMFGGGGREDGREIRAEREDAHDEQEQWWNKRREADPYYSRNTGEDYNAIHDNPFLSVLQGPLSTFSIDVDTASYANIRRFLNNNQLPPPNAVRIEEMVNYFTYEYASPSGETPDATRDDAAQTAERPFAVHVEAAGCPWNAEHRLLRVALKGREVQADKRPVCNLVFLIDVSGSMNEPNKLPLVKSALSLLTNQLNAEDRVAMVVYAGASGLALPSTTAADKQRILDAIDNLQAGGSTNGGEGIELAYKIAAEHFNKEGANRVILATDGDFNVGITDRARLMKLITDKAKSGVFLSVLGFGMGNLKDATLEQLADKGNGNYAYIDTFAEARKVFVDEIGGTLVTIAKDVKVQVDFNPAQVTAYRLIGYENRILAAQDFNNDQKDAGEIGAGHTVTALYEIVPASATVTGVDASDFERPAPAEPPAKAGKDTLRIRLRYKKPDGDKSTLVKVPFVDAGESFEAASADTRFAAAVAGFGMLLRNSPHKGDLTYDAVINLAVAAMPKDPSGQRSELVDLLRKAKALSGR